MPGKLILILSCMFSGKTETLITYARRYVLAKKNIVLIKYANDTRYDQDNICSHNRTQLKATYSCNLLAPLLENKDMEEADVILIDEGQFFKDAPFVCDFLANQGKVVIVAALNGTFKREEFPIVSDLLPLAEEVIHLKAVCSICGEDAHFTKRIVSGTSLELIGGAESYQPRCRSCFDKSKNENLNNP